MARLFEQSPLTTITDLTQRLAFGKAGSPTNNITFANFVTWLESVLGFLKTSENLNDLPNKTTARTNLDVYSTGEIDTALNLKADKTNVLEKDNTTSYTPISYYHPATKKYVDDGGTESEHTFVNTGSTITSKYIKAKQKGGRVIVNGWFETNGSDGTEGSPNTISEDETPGVGQPAEDVYIAAGANASVNTRVRIVAASGSGIRIEYTADSNSANRYYFNGSYDV